MLLVWPVAVPMGAAVLTLLAARSVRAQRVLSLAGALALLAAGTVLLVTVLREGPQAAQMGGWAAPYGITMVADLFSAALVFATGLMAVLTIFHGLVRPGDTGEHFGHHPLTQSLLLGICGAFLTGDLFNLYVWFEVMLIASFGLLVVGGRREQFDAAVKYAGLNLVATLTFLTGVGLLYGAAGTLNMADLHLTLAGRSGETAVLGAAMLLLFAFGAKAALFPVFFWLPASYHTLSITTSALFAALMTKVGVYALIRVFTLVYDAGEPPIASLLLWGGVLSMVVGVLGAAAQMEIRRILAFHSVSQIGYMVLGLALHTGLGLAGAIYYLFHHIVVKSNLFLIAGAVRDRTGSEDLRTIGGLWKRSPGLSILFLVSALSLAGLPPFTGFWAKLLVLRASLDAERYVAAFAVLAVGLLTLFSMTKIWNEAFWKPHPGDARRRFSSRLALIPVALLAAITLAAGVVAEPFIDAATEAAAQIVDPARYLQAVGVTRELSP
ncbi:proton-conducting transporter membrane subunit [Aureimonas populi]|uniref:Proton-conducting transporter membrane subunit n=1 Tax=Aureimonas populi TaxID=1701758 RepID=A0ABW5CP45_9HYPH|nr:proton-conducting transporter membrane subunit [Aureimonas populi]